MIVSEAVAETLARLGAKALFGLMGDGNMRIISHATEALGLAYYGARHESGAVAMADGYSRVSDAVGVCTVTQGPGVTNALTALTEAVKASSRVLLIAGATSTKAQGHNQKIDQDALFAAIENGSMRFFLELPGVAIVHEAQVGDEHAVMVACFYPGGRIL